MRTFLLLCLFIFSSSSVLSQIPTDDIKRYLFTNGSLINEANPGNSDLIATGNARTLTPDGNNIANNAVNLNGDSFNAGIRHASDPLIGAANVSISFWFKSNANNTNRREIISQNSSAYGWNAFLHDGKIKLSSKSTINGNNITPELLIESVDEIADNNWHHVVCIIDKALFNYSGFMYNGPQVTLYVDGHYQASNRSGGANTFNDILLNPTSQNIVIGQSYTNNIDDIRIYNKTLTNTEITDLSNAYPKTLIRFYVDQNATGANNGSSWTDAFTDLNSAITASNNKEVWVKSGTYKPHTTNRGNSFTISKNNIKLYGGFAGAETQLSDRVFGMNATILSGDLLGNDDNNISYYNATRSDNSFTVLNIVGDNIELDGLTITGGHANGASGSPAEGRYGGGIHKNNTTRRLTLTNCKLNKNVAKEAGGAIGANFSATGGSSSLTINNCEFTENFSAAGGAIYSANTESSTTTYTISNSLFNKNSALDNYGGATGYAGSSMWLRSYGSSSNVISNITNCTFVDNSDLGTATGMDNANRATIALTKNTGTTHEVTISNSIFWNNKAVAGAVANPIGHFIESIISSATIKNSTDQANFTGVTLSSSSANNNNYNPLFANLATGDYTIISSSPAVNSGDNTSVVGTTDLLGNQRIFGTNVDRGAYESGSSPLSNQSFTSFSDFNLYPNPVNSILNINSNEEIIAVEIYSIEGKKVLISKQTQVDVSHLNTGVYSLKITLSNGMTGTKKLIKH